MDSDTRWMSLALRLARKAEGTTSPNPAVGAVVVARGQAVGQGWTRPPGGPHAEIVALQEAEDAARGATLYVTLEPCSQQGRTGPCADALIRAGVAKVFVAMSDPDPSVRGSGIEKLRSAGVEVVTGLLEQQARRFSEAYIHHRQVGLPFVTYKVASTLDGKTAAADGSSRWITGEKARSDVHRLRALSDAICIGSGTLRADDPELTVRGGEASGKPPVRIVVSTEGDVPSGSRILSAGAPTLVVSTRRPADAPGPSGPTSAETITVPSDGGRVSIPHMLKELGERGIVSLLLEGGPALAASFLKGGHINRFIFYIAPKLLGEGNGLLNGWSAGSIGSAIVLKVDSVKPLGDDVKIVAYPQAEA